MAKTLLEDLTDRRRVCVLLRIAGYNYEESAVFLSIPVRTVRHELYAAAGSFPGLLDHRRDPKQGRSLRLAYLTGLSDAGVPVEELTAYLDSLTDRADWLRARSRLTDGSNPPE